MKIKDLRKIKSPYANSIRRWCKAREKCRYKSRKNPGFISNDIIIINKFIKYDNIHKYDLIF